MEDVQKGSKESFEVNTEYSVDEGKTMVLAYGAWSNVSSKFKHKGIAPCIGIGLRRYLSKHFIVADTPEHYTSQTCSGCLGKCGPFRELEERRRQDKLSMAVMYTMGDNRTLREVDNNSEFNELSQSGS